MIMSIPRNIDIKSVDLSDIEVIYPKGLDLEIPVIIRVGSYMGIGIVRTSMTLEELCRELVYDDKMDEQEYQRMVEICHQNLVKLIQNIISQNIYG